MFFLRHKQIERECSPSDTQRERRAIERHVHIEKDRVCVCRSPHPRSPPNSEIAGQHVDMSPELAAVQDADRLEAVGALGIARCMAYTGRKNRPFYDPAYEHRPRDYEHYCQQLGLANADAYTSSETKRDDSAVAHFYEKLLHLKDMLKTETGRKLGADRHQFMLVFLEEFFAEWEGSK